MEIEIGDYVRNEDGYIWQIKETKDLDNIFIDEDEKVKEIAGETVFGDDVIVEITKHSKNIIDLIEPGDYVNGYYTRKIANYNNELCAFDLNTMQWTPLTEIDVFYSIVTHEMFESIEYKVEEGK